MLEICLNHGNHRIHFLKHVKNMLIHDRIVLANAKRIHSMFKHANNILNMLNNFSNMRKMLS